LFDAWTQQQLIAFYNGPARRVLLQASLLLYHQIAVDHRKASFYSANHKPSGNSVRHKSRQAASAACCAVDHFGKGSPIGSL